MSALVAGASEQPRMDEKALSQALMKAQLVLIDRQSDLHPTEERGREILKRAALALMQMWEDWPSEGVRGKTLPCVKRKVLAPA